MKTTTQQNNVASNATENNVATSYKVFNIQGNLCNVIYQGNEYKGKLLNTSPTTHLKFANYDILIPSQITLDNGEKVYTKTTQYNGLNNQTKFKEVLNKLQNKSFSFDKATQAKATTRNNTTKANVLDYINANENLKNEYTTLKQQLDNAKENFEKAKTMFDAFIQATTSKANEQNALNTVEQLLKSGVLTTEQVKAMLQGGAK